MDISLPGKSLSFPRGERKGLIQSQFSGNPKPRNVAPQMHEYASGDQSSKAVDAAMRRLGSASKTSTSFATPLKRAAVVEKVAWGLAMYMVSRVLSACIRHLHTERIAFQNTLKAVGSPLKFNDREVDFSHLHIAYIFRPTSASMQPILEIREEFRSFYPYAT